MILALPLAHPNQSAARQRANVKPVNERALSTNATKLKYQIRQNCLQLPSMTFVMLCRVERIRQVLQKSTWGQVKNTENDIASDINIHALPHDLERKRKLPTSRKLNITFSRYA